MTNPKQLPEIKGLPELLRLKNGDEVKAPEDWALRKEEILKLYSEYMYGYMPNRTKETLTWSLEEEPETGGTLLNITVCVENRSASFSVLVGVPSSDIPEGGFPFYIEYWPWHYQDWFTKQWVTGFSDNCQYAMKRRYAGIQYDCSQVSQDNNFHLGAFYTLYPYDRTDPHEQRGALLAWAWGVSKIIDVMETGRGRPSASIRGCRWWAEYPGTGKAPQWPEHMTNGSALRFLHVPAPAESPSTGQITTARHMTCAPWAGRNSGPMIQSTNPFPICRAEKVTGSAETLPGFRR